MPKQAPRSVRDRFGHARVSMHPNAAGDLEALRPNLFDNPDFVELDPDGSPAGWQFGYREAPTGIDWYVGPSGNNMMRQNSPALPVRDPYMVNHALRTNHSLPNDRDAYPGLKPHAVLLKKIAAANSGFPAHDAQKPGWLRLSWAVKSKSGHWRHTTLSPPVSFTNASGQSLRVWIPPSIPQGVGGVGIWVAEPGQSTPSYTARCHLQDVVDLSVFRGAYKDLTGPYSYAEDEPSFNQTYIGQPDAPRVKRDFYEGTTAGGGMRVAALYRTDLGTSLVGIPTAETFTMGEDTREILKAQANFPPPEVTGVQYWVLMNNRWYVAADLVSGGPEAFRPPGESFSVGGTLGLIEEAQEPTGPEGKRIPPTYRYYLVRKDLPQEDTSGIPAPEARPDAPAGVGSGSLPPGWYFGTAGYNYRGHRGPVADTSWVFLNAGETLRMVAIHESNMVPNAEYTSIGSDGRPADYYTDTPGASVWVDNGKLRIKTHTVAANIYYHDWDPVPIDRTRDHTIGQVLELLYNDWTNEDLKGRVRFIVDQYDWQKNIIQSTQLGTDIHNYGRHFVNATLKAAGSTLAAGEISLNSATEYVRLRFFTALGGLVNLNIAVSHNILYDFLHRWRRTEFEAGLRAIHNPVYNPNPTVPAPIAATTITEVAPKPVNPGPDQAFGRVERPKSTGALEESQTFEAGLPAGFTVVRSTNDVNTSVATDAAAAIDGLAGLLADVAISNGTAYLEKIHTPAGRHHDALRVKLRVPVMPAYPYGTTGGQMAALVAPNGEKIAFLAWQTPHTEQHLLHLYQRPLGNGNVDITIGGVTTTIPVYRRMQRITYKITAAATASGGIQVWLPIDNAGNTTNYDVNVVAGDTAATVASKIHARGGYAHFNVSVTGDEVYFVGTNIEVYGPHHFFGFDTGVTATHTTTQTRLWDTEEDVAGRIAGTSFPGWVMRHQKDAENGSFGKNAVRWYATTHGDKGELSYAANGNRPDGFTYPLFQGSNTALLYAMIKDRNEFVYRDISTAVTTTSIFDVEIQVSGAGTADASVAFWLTGATGERTIAAKFDGMDLTGLPSSAHRFGVVEHSTAQQMLPGDTAYPSMNMRVHIDSYERYDYGKTYYREHNLEGQRIKQGYYSGPAGTIPVEGVPIREKLMAVMPGETYSIGLYGFYDGIPAARPAKPFQVTALLDDGKIYELGDVIGGDAGISGSADWAYFPRSYLIPRQGDAKPGGGSWESDCHIVRIHSQDVGVGEIIFQEPDFSVGSTTSHSSTYPANYSFRTIFDRDGAQIHERFIMPRKKVSLGTIVDLPTGVTMSIQYRAATTQAGLASAAWTTDPDSLPDLRFIEISGEFTSTDRKKTARVPSGSPTYEYLCFDNTLPAAVLLNKHREEFPGMVRLEKVRRHTMRQPTGVHRNWDGSLSVLPYAQRRGHQPGCLAYAYDPRVAKWIEEHWQDEMYIEANGHALRVQLAGQPEFTDEEISLAELPNGLAFMLSEAALADMAVLEAVPFGGIFRA